MTATSVRAPDGGWPAFDRPLLAEAIPAEVDRLLPSLAPLGADDPIPPLIDPDPPLVDHPVDEPLVPIEHRRIRTLAAYWHAGWPSARPDTMLRASVAARLSAAADSLPSRWGLAVFDAWRPLDLQRELVVAAAAVPDCEPEFLAPPSDDPRTPPPHLTGGSVDVTLTLDGRALALGTGFDDTTPAAHTRSLEEAAVEGARAVTGHGEVREWAGPPSRPPSDPAAERARRLRRVLYRVLVDHGFIVLHCEWWHAEWGTRRWAAITGGHPRYGPATPPASG